MGLRASDFPNQTILTPEELERERIRREQDLLRLEQGNIDLPSEQMDNSVRIMQEQVGTPELPVEENVSKPVAPAKITPSVKPGRTAALETALASDPEQMQNERDKEYEEDEASKLMGEYRKSRQAIEKEQAGLEEERARGESSRQMQTGIAGALQAFGQGLASITGGSAKPLETGVAALGKVGEQQAAAEERKARTLKERLQMAKAPLEEKQTEMELRSRISKGKLEQDLMDPASAQSNQARKNALSFVDNMIAQGTANRAAPEVLQRLEQTKALIGNMSAAQVQDFYNTLKPLSTETSLEAKSKFEMDKMAAQERLRTRLADAKDAKDKEKIAQKEFIKDQATISKDIAETAAVGKEMKSFRDDLKLAIAGDKKAAERVTRKTGVINYLNARSVESKGVFTDNDLKALSELTATKWFDQFNDYVSKGFTGTMPKASLMRIQDIIERNAYKFDNPTKFTQQAYAQKYKELDETDDSGVWRKYRRRFETSGKDENQEKAPAQQEPVAQPTEKIKVGDVIDGYRFTGGNVNDPTNWKQVK
jgi:hypothetical protein